MPGDYAPYVDGITRALQSVVVTDRSGTKLDIDEAIDMLCLQVAELKEQRRHMYLCGNGASASMASHLCVDWLKNAGVRATVFTDSAIITAYANDTGYDNSFAGPLRQLAHPGDLLVAISSSGSSPNVVAAIAAARELGLLVATLTGFRESNPARAMGDVNFYVPADTYGVTECSHQVILHAWLDRFIAQGEE